MSSEEERILSMLNSTDNEMIVLGLTIIAKSKGFRHLIVKAKPTDKADIVFRCNSFSVAQVPDGFVIGEPDDMWEGIEVDIRSKTND